MTVSQQTPVSNCWGNNSATEFSFNFYIAKESELLVEHTDLNGIKSTLENGVDYSIHEIGNKDGSYITFPLSGSKYKTLAWDTSTDKKELLTISLTLPIEQSAEYEDSGDLSKKNLELSFDYAIRLIQILNRTISRAVKVNEGDEVTPDQLIESLNESKRIAVDAATTATTQAENAQNSANIASEKADIATAKTAEVTETYNNAMADIQKDWQDAIDAIEEKQSTAETSITNMQSNAETVISNGMADITSNKEQSMSEIDENRKSSIEEILSIGTSNSQFEVFCMNSGKVDINGNAACVSIEENVITLLGETIGTTAKGKSFILKNNISLDISEYENGTYNLFYDPKGNKIIALANTIYIQNKQPKMIENDIWVNTSKVPYICNLYNKDGNLTDVDYIRMPATVVIDNVSGGGVVLKSNKYNTFNPIPNNWITKHQSLKKAVSPNILISAQQTLTFDLSDYLPDDDNDYEVMFTGYCYTSTVLNEVYALWIDTDLLSRKIDFMEQRCVVSGRNTTCGNTVILPVGKERKISIVNVADNTGAGELILIAYKKT